MSYLILLGLWAAVAQQIIAPPCPLTETTLQCVGVGEDCHADVQTQKLSWSNFPNTCPVGGTCKVCGDNSLVCSASNVCVRRSVGVLGSCITDFCLPNLRCVSNICIDPTDSWTPPGHFAQNGEPCNPANGNGDCLIGDGLVCNALTNKCDLPSVTSAVNQCSSRASCPAGQYCAPANTYGGPFLGRQCKQAITLSDRAGTLCVPGGSGQCGWTFSCVAQNPSESTGQFARTICLEFYSLNAGRQCSLSIYCKSGQCVGGFCVDPDYSTLGDACSIVDNQECGSWAQCGCPAQGGSRSRCVKTTTTLSGDFSKDEYFRQKPYLDCLDSNGCQSVNPVLGSCGWKNCRQHITKMTLVEVGGGYVSNSIPYAITVDYDLGIMPSNYKCEAFSTDGVPEYKGWKKIESGASAVQVSLSVFAVVAAMLLL